MDISKHDWNLFKAKLPIWQEAYMARLNEEYIQILKREGSPSDNFWELNRRIQKDRKNVGVIVELDRKMAVKTIVDLLNDEIITYDDLKDFSSELKDIVNFFINN